MGNLTLVAGSLSRDLHALEDWAEREILAKGEVLAEGRVVSRAALQR